MKALLFFITSSHVRSTIDVLIGDRLIARGEAIVINDGFGVRITEITHPDDKPKARWK